MVDFAKEIGQTNYQAYVPQDRTGEIIAAGEQRASQAQIIGANLLNKGLGAAVDVYNMYEVNKFTEDMNALNEEYMGSRTQSPMLTNNQRSLDKITSALEQGSMSPAEYNTRVRALTREAINRAPGFTQDFIQQANRVFEYSGMKSVLEFDTELLKSQQAQFSAYSKNVLDAAERAGIPVDYAQADNPNYLEALNGQSNQVFQRESIFKALETQVKTKDIWSKQDIDSAFQVGPDGKTLISKAFTGSSFATNATLQGIFSQVTDEKTFAAAKLQAQQAIVNQENEFVSALSSHIDDPRVKTMIDTLKATNKTRLDALNSFASKEDALKYVQNSMNLFKDQSYMDYYERNGINPQQEDAMIRLMQTPNLASIINQGKFTQFQGVVQGLIDKNLNAFSDPKLAKNVVDGAIPQLGSNPTIDEVVNGYAGALNANRSKMSPQQAWALENNYITSLATADPDKVKLMSDAGRHDALNLISRNVQVTWGAMVQDIQGLSAEGKNIQLDALPDGKIILRGDISGADAAKYTKRINDSLQAMANVMGTSTKEAAQKYFYPSFNQGSADTSKLNKAEKGMAKDVQLSASERAADVATNISDASIKELETAIKSAKGSAKQVLQQELTRLLDLKKVQTSSAPTVVTPPQQLSQADIDYFAAQDKAEKQREQFYSEVAEATGIGIDKAKESLEGTLDFITNNILPNIGGQEQIKSASDTLDKLLKTVLPKLDIRWDWERYKKTGELHRRNEGK
jgi:hypothetical protein